MKKPFHRYHLVSPSPWPLLSLLAVVNVITAAISFFHNYENNPFLLIAGFLAPLPVFILWWRDVIQEATFQGKHTTKVQINLRFGFALFIVSEVMFFFGFFWAFFHSSLSPEIDIGATWPPFNIDAPEPWGIPLFNTIILLLSGASITYTHHQFILGQRTLIHEGFIFTIFCAVNFLWAQVVEFIYAPFSISDSVFASAFFMLSGFHGAHVIVGTLFIIVCYIRFIKNHFLRDHHVGFEAAVWYWHFVDVVWLFLFIFVYYWGGDVTI